MQGKRFHSRPLAHVLLIAVVCLAAYSNTFRVPFVLDDHEEIVGNPVVEELRYFAHPSEAKGFPTYHSLKMRYVGYLTFALNHRLHGYDLAGYHAVNLAVHVLNALLVYALVLSAFRTPALSGSALSGSSGGIALFSALLFGSHPVQTQAVTYVVQRLASLATLFYLLGVVSYARARLASLARPSGRRFPAWYLLSLLSCVLAMKTKEIAFTLPVAIALYEFLFFEGGRKKRALYLLPLFLTMLIIPWSLVGGASSLGEALGEVSNASRLEAEITTREYLLTQVRVVVTYVRLLFLPVSQNIDYSYTIHRSALDAPVFLSLLFLLGIAGLGVCLYRGSGSPGERGNPAFRLISFGIFWFFLALSVESSLIPIADVIFEHRVYLPSVGVSIALAASAYWWKHRLDSSVPAAGRAIVPALALAVLGLSAATYARNTTWRSEVLLWEDAVRKSPSNARARTNLGAAYHREGRPSEAIREYQAAISFRPDYFLPYSNLGAEYAAQGRLEAAEGALQAAIRLRPGYADAHYNLGNVYADAGEPDRAIAELQTAVRLKPYLARTHSNLGAVYARKGLLREAEGELMTAIRLRPGYADAHFNLGNVYGGQRRYDEAVREFRAAIASEPNHAAAIRNLEMTLSIRR